MNRMTRQPTGSRSNIDNHDDRTAKVARSISDALNKPFISDTEQLQSTDDEYIDEYVPPVLQNEMHDFVHTGTQRYYAESIKQKGGATLQRGLTTIDDDHTDLATDCHIDAVPNDGHALNTDTPMRLSEFNDHIQFKGQMEPPFRYLNPTKTMIYQEWIDDALKKGWIEQCERADISLYAVPQIVPKPNGNFRITHDCRFINSFSDSSNKFPSEQFVEPLVIWARGRRRLGHIDLVKAFHTVPLAHSQRQFYGFECNGYTFRYIRMPMGAAGAPRHFHKIMGEVLSKLPHELLGHVRYYQDDILYDASIPNLQSAIMSLLRSFNFVLNLEKCHDGDVIPILGFEWNNKTRTLTIPAEKLENLRKAYDDKNLPRLVGMLNWLSPMLPRGSVRFVRKANNLKDTDHVWSTMLEIIRHLHSVSLSGFNNADALDLYIDTSSEGTGLSLRCNDAILFDESMPPPDLATSSKELEGEGAAKLIKKNLSRLKAICTNLDVHTLNIFTDNTGLMHAMNADTNAATPVYIQQLKALFSSFKTRWTHVSGKVNPADSVSRRAEGSTKMTYAAKARANATMVPEV